MEAESAGRVQFPQSGGARSLRASLFRNGSQGPPVTQTYPLIHQHCGPTHAERLPIGLVQVALLETDRPAQPWRRIFQKCRISLAIPRLPPFPSLVLRCSQRRQRGPRKVSAQCKPCSRINSRARPAVMDDGSKGWPGSSRSMAARISLPRPVDHSSM
jgi:hypothetical protein